MAATRTPDRTGGLLTFDRGDRTALSLVLGLVAAATLVAQVVLPLVSWARGSGLGVDYLGPVRVAALDRAGLTHESVGSVAASVTDPTAGQRLLDLVPGVLLTAVVVTGCALVLAVLRGVASGDAFTDANVRRLRVLAFVVAVGLPVAWAARAVVDLVLVTSLELGADVAGAVVEIPWAPVTAGAVVALVAEAFRQGARLREDVEGLV